MISRPVLLLLPGLFMVGQALSLEGDPEMGQSKAATCIACHGANGISPNEAWPNLAGQKQGYLIKQLEAFRNGDRVDPSMTSLVKDLSDQDIRDLAAFFSSMEVKTDG